MKGLESQLRFRAGPVSLLLARPAYEHIYSLLYSLVPSNRPLLLETRFRCQLAYKNHLERVINKADLH